LRNFDSTNHNTTVRSTHQHITATSVEYSKEFRPTTTKHCAANCTIELATFSQQRYSTINELA
ncbi:unnamed protein product, partial [Ceratitis capitata]